MVRLATPSGVRTASLPKKTRGEAVAAQLTLRYGNEKSLKGLTGAGELLPMVLTRGTKRHTREEIEDELNKQQARITHFDSTGEMTFLIECKRDNLLAVLRLLGEILRESSFDAKEFEILKRETRDDLKKNLTDPFPLADQALRSALNPYPAGDVRHVPTLEKALARMDAVTQAPVKALCAEQLGGAAGDFVVVGDCDAAETTKLIGEVLKDWKAAVAYERIALAAHTEVAADKKSITTPDKENAIYLAGHAAVLSDRDADYAALKVADFIFGNAPLSNRLGNRIRQKEGLSYGVASMLTADPREKSATFETFAITNPGNIDKVEKAVQEELQLFVDKGVNATELEEAKKAYVEQIKVARTQDSQLAGLVAAELYAGRTFAYWEELEKKVAGLTVDDVNAAIKKHLQPRKVIQIRASDFKQTSGK